MAALRGGPRLDGAMLRRALPIIPRGAWAKIGGGFARTTDVGSERELREHRPVVRAPRIVDRPCPHRDEVIREEDVVDAHERYGGDRAEARPDVRGIGEAEPESTLLVRVASALDTMPYSCERSGALKSPPRITGPGRGSTSSSRSAVIREYRSRHPPARSGCTLKTVMGPPGDRITAFWAFPLSAKLAEGSME